MNTALAVLLIVLKIIGALVLLVLALVLAVSLLPMGARIDYRPDALTVDAVLGPVRLHLLPRRSAKAQKSGAAPPAKTAAKPAAGAPAPGPGAAPKPRTAAPARAAPKTKTKAAPAAAPAPEGGAAAPAAPGFADRLLAAVRRDPVLFIERVVTHALFAGGSLLRGVRVTDLWVYWPVHADEAANTALLHAGLLAALNNALVRLKEHMTIRPQELWLEPDFTGEQTPRRRAACTVTMRPIVLLVLAPRLAWRIWHDPAFAGVLPFTKALDQAS